MDVRRAMGTDKILKLLEPQNMGLSTKEWRVVLRKADPKGIIYVFYIDEKSSKALSMMGTDFQDSGETMVAR